LISRKYLMMYRVELVIEEKSHIPTLAEQNREFAMIYTARAPMMENLDWNSPQFYDVHIIEIFVEAANRHDAEFYLNSWVLNVVSVTESTARLQFYFSFVLPFSRWSPAMEDAKRFPMPLSVYDTLCYSYEELSSFFRESCCRWEHD
jgi:hypothetical protein